MNRIDIIIPIYNQRDYLFTCLSSIAIQSIVDLCDITIINDASDEDYSDIINFFSKYLSIVEIKINNNKVNKSLYRASPSLLLNKLINKCKEYNTILNIIKNEPTTQTCSRCDHRYYKEEKLTLFDRVYKCNNCGLEIGRDENSAINIFNIVQF